MSNKIITGLVALGLTAIPVTAHAGGNYHSSHSVSSSSCSVDGGSTCAPGPATEEVVPEYFDVPSKTQHIYYDKPAVEPVVTKIVHHVPTAVYGRQHVTETIHAGQWTGPSLGCCDRPQPVVHETRVRVAKPAPVRVVQPAPVRIVHPVYINRYPVPVPVPTYPCGSIC